MADEKAGTILLIESNAVLRELLQQVLLVEGYRVAVAVDGNDALRRLRDGLDPCLILLDVRGARAAADFRRAQVQDADLATIPTVAFSGVDWQRGDVERVGLPFLKKPFEVRQLLQLAARHCSRSAAPRPTRPAWPERHGPARRHSDRSASPLARHRVVRAGASSTPGRVGKKVQARA